MNVEKRISEYVKERGIKLTTISQSTGIPYSCIRPSFAGDRMLRAGEFLSICEFLGIEPNMFV